MNKIKVYKDVLGTAYKSLLFVVLLEALSWSFFALSITLLEKEIINYVLYHGSRFQMIYSYAVALLVLILAIWVISKFRYQKISNIGKHVRDRIMNVLVHVDLGKINVTSRDKMITGITQDTGNFSRFLKSELFEGIKTLTTIVVMASTTAIFNWRFFILSMSCSILFAFTLPLSKKLEHIEKKQQSYSEDSIKQLTNIKGNVVLFHIFPGTTRYFANFLSSIKNIVLMETAAGKFYCLLITLAWGSNIIREMGILIIGLVVLKLEIGTVIALFTITSFMNSAIVALINIWANFQKSYVASVRIKTILELPQEEIVMTGQVESNRMIESILEIKPVLTLMQIGFTYPETMNGVKPFTMEVPFGSIIHVKGDIGSGKSTMIKLISGILSLSEGEIRINGKLADLKTLREISSIVDQGAIIFEGSILENITLFEGDPNIAKVEQLISMVRLDEWIREQKEGIYTVLGQDVQLSGGQRQRLAICRALYKETPILILDEATSALDNENEQIIFSMISRLKGNKTIFLIDHRERLASISDFVIYFKNGDAQVLAQEERRLGYEEM
ncbi:ABC transporter ATP-binding protein [Paenibacillus sp.]|uniref:ABC transporter ATP-binding protein n=1 Tax=Paenibacillus sp. TaxID=58172 RepID=UPI0028A6E30D|nr:ABC transporter ATP-binding protein [Paenibacillus sp.]